MTITQTIQQNPVKANEIFNKLAETSDGAVKTRERLFSELKGELELLVQLEEQHLFPVLRKHKETKDLVSDALNDTKQVRALLAELERMPKNDEGFPGKLAELKRVFQQHVRDEKKELLPAVRKALSDDETQVVVEKIEEGKAKAEEEQQAAAAQRRAEARREREAAEHEARREHEAVEQKEAEVRANQQRAREAGAAVARSAENIAQGGLRVVEAGGRAAEAGVEAGQQVAQAGAEAARRTADAVQQTTRSVVDNLGRAAESATGQMRGIFDLSAPEAQETLRRASQDARAVLECSTVLTQGVHAVWREWLSYGQQAIQCHMEGLAELMQARSPGAMLAAQGDLLKAEVELLLKSSRQISEMSAETAHIAAERFDEVNGGQSQRHRARKSA